MQSLSMYEHEAYMRAALDEAKLALDLGEFPVGVVLVADGEIVVRASRRNSQAQSRNEIDHAEINALRILLERHAQVEPSRVSAMSFFTSSPPVTCAADTATSIPPSMAPAPYRLKP